MENFYILIPLGIAVGTLGTLIGAGGGFVLMPLLLLFFPSIDPGILASISLAVVFFNTSSGSISYARMKRIEYKSGLYFTMASIPGSIVGALTTDYLPRAAFHIIFGILLISASIFLLSRPPMEKHVAGEIKKNRFTVKVTDISGIEHILNYNLYAGIAVSFFVGFLSSLIGFGGGIIHVPVLVYAFNFPVHIATATSHFVLALTSFTGTITHFINGDFQNYILTAVYLSIGAVIGAQIGARLSNKLKGSIIIKGLAVALGMVGIRLLVMM